MELALGITIDWIASRPRSKTKRSACLRSASCLPSVRFVLETLGAALDEHAQDAAILSVVGLWAKSRPHLDLVLLSNFYLAPIELVENP